MSARAWLDRLLKKPWTEADVKRYVGSYRQAYLTHASLQDVRSRAASGGSTSALLIHGLRTGTFDGAVVCRVVLRNGKVRPEFLIATSEAEILASRGSKYVETRFLPSILPLLRAFEGRVAVVGLPCDIAALRQRCAQDATLEKKVVLTIALVCGHNSRVGLIDAVTERIEKKYGSSITDYRFRVGHWRGRLEADLDDGSTISLPTKSFNDYQNMYFFCERKCLSCFDHYGYAADITVGDVWIFRLKDDPIKHTGVITRSLRGQALFDSAVHFAAIVSRQLDIRDIMDGQARIGPAHYNVSSRVVAGRFLGIKLPDRVHRPVTWHSFLNSLLSISAMRLSESEAGRRLIFLVPRPFIRTLLYFKKCLESIP